MVGSGSGLREMEGGLLFEATPRGTFALYDDELRLL